MYLEAVIVSIHFGDYLAETLPRNLSMFDHLVVVTCVDDEETQRLCHDEKIDLVVTERHLEGGGFDKGKAINDGMRKFHFKDWLCHLDADIIVPGAFRRYLPNFVALNYRPGMIFGCQRLMCESLSAWQQFLITNRTRHFRPDNRRTVKHWPVGFFQLWQAEDHQWYPEGITVARSSDIEFSKKFRYRCHSEESVIHLSADQWERGRDDLGRTTLRWGADDASPLSGKQ